MAPPDIVTATSGASVSASGANTATVHINADIRPSIPMLLQHPIKEIQRLRRRFDAVQADPAAQLHGKVDLRLEECELVLEGDAEGRELARLGVVVVWDAGIAVDADFS